MYMHIVCSYIGDRTHFSLQIRYLGSCVKHYSGRNLYLDLTSVDIQKYCTSYQIKYSLF